MKLHAFILPILFALIIGLFSSDASDIRTKNVSINTGSVEGVALLAPKNQPVRFGGGFYGRPTSSNSSQASSDSILVVLKGESVHLENSDRFQVLNQKDQEFMPSLLPVTLGEKVRIKNSDPVYHNVFSLTSPNKFDVGRRPKGEHFDVTFDKAGVVDVFCDIHSNMYAIIYVLPEGTVAWTKIKSGDSFSFQNISAGSYELSLFALGYKENTTQINVHDGEAFQTGAITINP
ncbi:MAG: hypothetical protein RLN90_02650 [Balneolaceae bacterium]